MGKIHSFETLGGLDGPALRTVVFFQGCPMRCSYCHNPDTFTLNRGVDMLPSEVAAFCARYKNYFGNGGGVTLSGGEPLFQEQFCFETIVELISRGISVALDTAGSVYSERCLSLCDLVILDIKSLDESDFFDLTGYQIDNTFRTLDFLKKRNKRFWVRQVIVPDYNDTESNAIALANAAFGAEKIQLLGYHTMGVAKYKELGIKYRLDSVPPMDSEKLAKLQAIVDSQTESIKSRLNKSVENIIEQKPVEPKKTAKKAKSNAKSL